MKLYCFTFVLLAATCLGQDDPQDVAEIACEYDGAMYEFNTDTGVIESPNYPNDYGKNQDCHWFINPTNGIPEGQMVVLEVREFETEYGYDELWVYEGEGSIGTDLKFFIGGSYSNGSFFYLGDEKITLLFNSDSKGQRKGFRVEYYFGEPSPAQALAELACDDDTRPAFITHTNSTLIETFGFPDLDHGVQTECEWRIQPDNFPGGIYISVIFFNTNVNELYFYFDDDSEMYWEGRYSPGYSIYTPGSAITMYYDGHLMEPGFQLLYYPADIACTSGSGSHIPVGGRGEINSPGYPYILAEDLSCRWWLEAPEDQQILLTSLDMDLNGDGEDCTDEYVEILDGDTEDAISLGKFCGDVSFGTIPSSGSSFQIHLRTETSTQQPHIGFVFSYQLV